MTHSLQQVADHLGVSVRTVQAWIADGSLRAINVSRSRSSRKPRLRVLDSDLQAFLAGRVVGQPQQSPRRRRSLPAGIRQYV